MANNDNQAVPEEPLDQWLLVSDRREARLLRGALTEHGRLHLETEAALQEHWDEHQHGRPSPRAAKDGHGYASIGHEEEERTHRFAKEVASWLEAEVDARRITSLHAFCAPKMLGPLRKVLPARIRERVCEHATDLSRLSPGELAVHPGVLEALAADESPA